MDEAEAYDTLLLMRAALELVHWTRLQGNCGPRADRLEIELAGRVRELEA